jgi:hypothetical protein
MKCCDIFALAIMSIVAWCGCRKPLPTGNDDLPKFYFAGTINNEPITLEAGRNNIFMHTSCFVDADKILTMQGNLANETNLDSGISLQVYFKSPTVDTNTISSVNTWLTPKTFYSYSKDSSYTLTTNYKKVQFLFTGNTIGAVKYDWDLGNGNKSNAANPLATYNTEGKKIVSCKVKYSNGLEDFLINEIDISFDFNNDGQIMVERTNPDTLLCTANGSNIVWELPNGTTANGNAFKYTTVVLQRAYIKATGTVNNKQFNYKQLIVPKFSNVLVNYNFQQSDSIASQFFAGANNLGKVIITCRYKNNVYASYKQSHLLKQNNNSVFDITSSKSFIKNEQGLDTYAMTTALNGYLYNIKNNSDSIAIKSDRLSLAVAVK